MASFHVFKLKSWLERSGSGGRGVCEKIGIEVWSDLGARQEGLGLPKFKGASTKDHSSKQDDRMTTSSGAPQCAPALCRNSSQCGPFPVAVKLLESCRAFKSISAIHVCSEMPSNHIAGIQEGSL